MRSPRSAVWRPAGALLTHQGPAADLAALTGLNLGLLPAADRPSTPDAGPRRPEGQRYPLRQHSDQIL